MEEYDSTVSLSHMGVDRHRDQQNRLDKRYEDIQTDRSMLRTNITNTKYEKVKMTYIRIELRIRNRV